MVPLASATKAVTFGGFKCRVTLFCVAAMVLRDATCFITCQKSFCVTSEYFLRPCQQMNFMFRGRRSTLETCSFCFGVHKENS